MFLRSTSYLYMAVTANVRMQAHKQKERDRFITGSTSFHSKIKLLQEFWICPANKCWQCLISLYMVEKKQVKFIKWLMLFQEIIAQFYCFEAYEAFDEIEEGSDDKD